MHRLWKPSLGANPPVGAAGLGDVTNCTKGGVLPTEAGKPWPEQKQCTCVAQGARALTHRHTHSRSHLSMLSTATFHGSFSVQHFVGASS